MTTAQKRGTEPPPTTFDLGEFLRLLSTALTRPLEDELGNKEAAGRVKQVVETAVFATITRLSHTRRGKNEKETAIRRKYRKDAVAKRAKPLPVEDLTPAEVVELGLVEMSVANLYRATKEGRYYCAKPRGKRIGRIYPAWQFVEPVTNILPEVLSVLKEQGETYIHARMVTAEDELMELAPAEVLAGRLFDVSEKLSSSQAALLALPPVERLAIVKKVFGKPSREHRIG